MAIYRPSGLASAISGAVGGVEFVHGRGAAVLRKRQHKISRTSTAAANRAAILRKIANRWGDTTAEERDLWTATAQQLPQRNRLGQFRTLNAWQLYLKTWLSQTEPSDSIGTKPSQFVSPPSPPTITLAFDGLAYDVQYVHDPAGSGIDANIFAWRWFSTSPHASPPYWKFIQTSAFSGLSGTVDIKTAFDAVMGPLEEDEFVSVRLHTYLAGGIPGRWIYADTVRTA